MENNEKCYGLYVRVSTVFQARQEEGSLKSQVQRLKDYLKFANPEARYRIYEESGKSAKDTNRPEYQRLMNDIKSGEIQAVACTEISRLSRSTRNFLDFIEDCHKYQVDFISLRENFDTSTALGRAMMTIFIALAQYEREQTSERTMLNMQARAERGLYNGGYVYGYRVNPDKKGHLFVDEHEARIVNIIFDRYLETGSYCNVAKWLNRQGYQTREYTSKRGKFHPAGKWKKTAVWQMLQNFVYIAKRKIKDGKYTDAVWEPIVSITKWHRVQRMLKKNYETRSNNSVANDQHTYLFTGLLKCMHCDVGLENTSGTGNQGRTVYFYYRHPGSTRKEGCPYTPYLPAEELENVICDKILGLIDDDETLKVLVDQIFGRLKTSIGKIQKEIEWVENKVRALDDESSGLLKKMPLLEDEQVREIVSPKLKEILEQKNILEEKRQKLFDELLSIKEEPLSPENICEMISPLAAEFYEMEEKQKQQILGVLVEKIELYSGEMKVYLRVGKKKSPELSSKFEEMLPWLP